MGGEAIRLAIVDDHEIVRLGIHRVLEGEKEIELVGEAVTGDEAVEMVRSLRPEVILVDVKLPDISGIEVVRRLKDQPDTAGVQAIMLTVYDDLEIATEAIRAGAIGYILKDCGREQLLAAIRSAVQGVPLISPTISKKLFRVLRRQDMGEEEMAGRSELPLNLTEREYDVLRLVTKGFSNKAIANELCITLSTVKTHMRNIYRKLEVDDRAHAIIKAIKEGIA